MTATTNDDSAPRPNGKSKQATAEPMSELAVTPTDGSPVAVPAVGDLPPEPKNVEITPSVFDFLGTENGKTLGMKAFEVAGAWIAATKGAEAEVRKSQTDLQAKQMEHRVSAHRLVLATQMAGLAVVIGAIVLLSLKSLLTPEAGTLLGAVAGYLFGRRSSDSPT